MVSLFRRARYPCVFAALLLSAAQCDCFVRSTASSSTPTRQVPDTPWSKSKSSSNRQHSPSTEEYDDQALAINMQVVKLRKRTGGGRPTRLVASRAKSLVDSVKRDIFTKSNAGSVDESGHTAEDDSAFGSTVASRKLSQLELRGGIKRDAQSALGRLRLRSPAVLIRGAGTGATVGADDGGSRGTGWANAAEGLKNGLASGLAAAAVKTVLQPFDTMKTVQQFSTSRMSLVQAGRDLLVRGGVRELYQGLGVTLIGSMPSVGVYFGLYQFVKKQLDSRGNMSPYLSVAVSAGVGNFVASFFRVPYEVVKQRLQVGAYPTTMVALQSIYKQGGLAGFFGKGGLKTQWARDIPYAIVTLLVYETLQNYAAKRRGPGAEEKGSPVENMVIGAIAGGMGSLVTNPMDMIKTRMMTSPELYASPMDAVWTVLKTEGPPAFLKGATPRLLHKIPANAFFFVAYEFFRNVLGVKR